MMKSQDQAKKIIQDLGLVYGETTVTYSPNVAKGAVIGILLPPGTDLITSAQQVVKGSTVDLVVSNGLVKVPDLTGKSVLDIVVDELALITGQRPVRRKAKKSIANFGQREGQEIGASVTLRGARMWEFLDRFISTAVPRIRDFRGLSAKQFDGRGNYTFGLTEQVMFHEIDQDKIDRSRGMDITVVTTATNDDEGRALLKLLGFPYKEN